MPSLSRVAQLAAAVLAGALLATGGYALAASATKTIHACVSKTSHVLAVEKHCGKGQTTLTWNQQGPAGQAGRTGATGPAGPDVVGAFGIIAFDPGAHVSGVTSENLAVTSTGTGTAVVNLTGGPCVNQTPTITATAQTATGGSPALAYVSGPPNGSPSSSFGVTVGSLTSGGFAPQDGISVHVAVYCKVS
jgi:hypothetical protein